MAIGTDRDEVVVLVAEAIVHAEWLKVSRGHDTCESDVAGELNATVARPPTCGVACGHESRYRSASLGRGRGWHTAAPGARHVLATQRSPP
jgi:hypothetical protein